jgi:hypothetical protein
MNDDRMRRLENGLNFLSARMRVMGYELAWAIEGKPLPPDVEQPLKWVRRAIVRVTETSLAPVYRCDPSKNPQKLRENFLQLLGMFAAEAITIGNFGTIIEKEFADVPFEARERFQRWAEGIAADLEPLFAQFVSTLERLRDQSATQGVIPSLGQVQENVANLHAGTVALLNSDGEFVEGKSNIAQLYFLSWFYWPQLKFVTSALQFKQGIEEMTPDVFGIKTVEYLYSELRIADEKRTGRAK